MRYSKTTQGFYPESIDYPILPDDLVFIDDAYYSALLANTDENLEIVADENGYPFLAQRAKQSIEQLRATMQLSAAEARRRLASKGILCRIIETINAMPDDSLLKINWEYETIFKRTDPILCDFCKQSLGYTDEQIDNLFTGDAG